MSGKYKATFAVCSGIFCSLLCFKFSEVSYKGKAYSIVDAVNMAMSGNEFFQEGAKKVGIVTVCILTSIGIIMLFLGSVYNFFRKRYENVIANTYLFELFGMVSGILIMLNAFSKYRGYSLHVSGVMYLIMLLSVLTSFIIKLDVGKISETDKNALGDETLPSAVNEEPILNEHAADMDENTVKICTACFNTYDGKFPVCPRCR